jgi:uncharacterized membrane protein
MTIYVSGDKNSVRDGNFFNLSKVGVLAGAVLVQVVLSIVVCMCGFLAHFESVELVSWKFQEELTREESHLFALLLLSFTLLLLTFLILCEKKLISKSNRTKTNKIL